MASAKALGSSGKRTSSTSMIVYPPGTFTGGVAWPTLVFSTAPSTA